MTALPPPSILRRRLLIAGAALPAACASPVAQLPAPASPPPAPKVSVGQRWRYEKIDLYRGQRVDELNAQVIRMDASVPQPSAGAIHRPGAVAPLVVALTDARGAPIGEEQWARPWYVIVEHAYDAPQTFEAPMPLLPDRLEPGAGRNDATYYSVPMSSARLFWSQSLRATGWERIEVPAGRFDALRVHRHINFLHWDGWREYPWRADTLWYAPEVGRWVQREWTGEYRWPGGRRGAIAYEDRVRWRLLEWQPG